MPEQIPLMVDAVTQELRQFTSDETIPQCQLLAALQVALTGLVTSNTSGVLESDTILQALGKLQAQTSNKVDKVAGKQLSTEDFTSAEKTKLAGIAAGAQVNSVTSVAGRTGAVVLAKADVGLGSVDNTSDSAKPVSTAQQTALNLKANLASPALTGTPTAPTAADGTSTTQLATTAFVHGAVGGFLSKTTTGGTTTLTTAEASNPIIKVSGALTSNAILEIPVASKRNYSIENATTGAFTLTVKHVGLTPSVLVAQGKRNIVMTNGVGAYDAINDFESIALTGTPTAPTAGSTTNNTQVATTAFVQAVNTADTGSSATALKLKTARTIGGVSFDGSANINLPGVNTAGNQNTTGSAATLTTARTINGTSFNGSANITTANWGTSRNLTIGSTAKAVNGSANVAWTLAEIGAFPSANVVGTMAGGAIIESGANANGTYTKFADGTLICIGEVTTPAAELNVLHTTTWNLPTAFVDTNYAVQHSTYGVVGSGSIASAGSIVSNGVVINRLLGSCVLTIFSYKFATEPVAFSLTTIGRWK